MKPVVLSAAIILVIITSVLLAAVTAKNIQEHKAMSQTTSVFSITQSKAVVALGDTVDVTVMLDPSNVPVYEADAVVQFDPHVFSGLSFVNAGLFPAGFTLLSGNISATGAARIVLGNQPDHLIRTAGPLATLHLKAIAPTAQSKITVTSASRISTTGSKILTSTPAMVTVKVCTTIDANNPAQCSQ